MSQSMKNRSATMGKVFSLGICLLLLTAMPDVAFAAERQSAFPTPEKAVDALVFAARHEHKVELLKILGPGADKLVSSGDDVADREGREKFVTAYDKAHKIEDAGTDRKVLAVGEEEWPMPIPLVRDKDGWRFDTAAGELEILNRRIGRNELNVIEVCRAYVEAQRDFAALDSDRHEYAQSFQSNEGKHDGLYWEVKDGEKESPLGPLIASATAEGYSDTTTLDKRTPYHGYYYKILKSQGEHAAGGKMDYLKDGHMTGGFALIAFPATYGDSGVMSFIVDHNGIVYEKNLGPETSSVVEDITEYDPDETWVIVQ
jgi:hypothetical protein